MASTLHTIEVDEATATLLRDRADARGISVDELIDGMTALAETLVELSPEELADLDRQMAAIDSGEEATYPHDDVERWLAAWGTLDYKPLLRAGSLLKSKSARLAGHFALASTNDG